MVVLYSPKPDMANDSLIFIPYSDVALKTSVASRHLLLSLGLSLSSNFTHDKFKFPAFLQKKYLVSRLAKAFMVIPIFPDLLLGDFCEYQLLKSVTLPPMVPKAPFFQPGKASILLCVALTRF